MENVFSICKLAKYVRFAKFQPFFEDLSFFNPRSHLKYGHVELTKRIEDKKSRANGICLGSSRGAVCQLFQIWSIKG